MQNRYLSYYRGLVLVNKYRDAGGAGHAWLQVQVQNINARTATSLFSADMPQNDLSHRISRLYASNRDLINLRMGDHVYSHDLILRPDYTVCKAGVIGDALGACATTRYDVITPAHM